MTYIRKNIMNILLFILWVGMSASITTANADVQGGGATGENYSIDLAFITPSEGAKVTELLSGPEDEREPALSPDGRWIAYVSDESDRSEVNTLVVLSRNNLSAAMRSLESAYGANPALRERLKSDMSAFDSRAMLLLDRVESELLRNSPTTASREAFMTAGNVPPIVPASRASARQGKRSRSG